MQPEHLEDVGALLELHRQAVALGLAQGCEAGQFDFLALANRARSQGHNPGALLFWLLKNRCTERITFADEEVARRQQREHREGPATRQQGRAHASSPPALTEEERTVQACLRTARQHRADPFRVARMVKDWSRDEWDAAHLRYRQGQLQRQGELLEEEAGLARFISPVGWRDGGCQDTS